MLSEPDSRYSGLATHAKVSLTANYQFLPCIRSALCSNRYRAHVYYTV